MLVYMVTAGRLIKICWGEYGDFACARGQSVLKFLIFVEKTVSRHSGSVEDLAAAAAALEDTSSQNSSTHPYSFICETDMEECRRSFHWKKE